MFTNLIRLATKFGLIAGALATAATAQISLSACLSGAFETPPNASTAAGSATLSYDPVTTILSCSASVTGMTGTAAHIHTGAAGVPGPILIPLAGGPTSFSGSAAVPAGSLTALLHAGLYVNIHSAAFPGGQVRGQILISENLTSYLSGAKETPPNASTAVGEAQTMVDQLTGALHCTVLTAGIAPTAAHIHRGAAGVAGPIVFPLPSTGPGMFELAGVVLSNTDLIDLLTGKLYVNVHSAAFPGGEIRDQIRAAGLNANGDTISVITGGALELSVDLGTVNAGQLFLVLGSLSGTSPGIPIAGNLFPLSLNPDFYFSFTLTNHVAPLSGSFGVLNGSGKATAKFSLPPGSDPTLVGVSGHHAAIGINIVTITPTTPTCPKKFNFILL